MENSEQDHLAGMDLQLEGEVRHQLNDAAKWSRFISVVVFFACGLVLVSGTIGGAAIFNSFRRLGNAGDIFTGFGGSMLIVVIFFMVAVVALVYYFLFNFSAKIKSALISESITELNAGLRSLKIFFIITTVFAILSLLNTIVKLF